MGVHPNFKGNKNSGRKTLKEELARYKEKIKDMTIEELAESKVYSHLEKSTEDEDRQGIKDIALPVYLKSKADKVVSTVKQINMEDPDNYKEIQKIKEEFEQKLKDKL